MSDEVEVRVWLSMNKVGSRVEYDTEFEREDWDTMSPTVRNEVLLEILMDSGLVEWGWKEVGGD